MYSKPQVLALLFSSSVNAVTVTTGYTAESSAAGLGCAQCIRSGFLYNVPTNQDSAPNSQNVRGLLASGDSYAGECCTDDTDTTNCASSLASSGTLATNWVSLNALDLGIDKDIAVHACPTKEDFCGSTKEIVFADATAADVTVTMSGSWTTSDQCTWLVKAECGAPGLIINNSTSYTDVTDSDVEVFYMEYNTAEEVVLDSTDTNWPAFYTTGTTAQVPGIPDYTQTNTIDFQGELPYFKQVTQVSPETYRSIPGKMAADWMWMKRTEFANFDEAVIDYDVLRADYDAYTTEWNTFLDDNLANCGLDCILDYYFGTGMFSIAQKVKPPVPLTPISYTGPEQYDSGTHSTVLGYLQEVETWGLGKLTADILTMAGTGYGAGKAFGTLGQGINNTLAAKFTEEDSSACFASYYTVTVIPKTAQPGTSVFEATLSSNEWVFSLEAPTNPTAATALVERTVLPDAMTDWMTGWYDDAY